MDEEDKHCPSEFYYPEDLETFNTDTGTGITDSDWRLDNPCDKHLQSQSELYHARCLVN